MRKTLSLLAVVAVSLLGAGTAATVTASAASQTDDGQVVIAEAPRQVTGNPNPTRLFSIPTLAVHPDDPSTVVMAVGDARYGGCGLRVSRDGGLSWVNTGDLLPERFKFCYQRPLFPVMDPAFTPDGTLYVAMPGSSPERGHPDGPISMLVARTSDLGRTHQTTVVAEGKRITADPADFGQKGKPGKAVTWHKAPSLVVDPDNPDKLYLAMRWNVWGTDSQSFPGDVPFRPRVAVSDDGGETWSEPIDMIEASGNDSIYGALHLDMVAGPDGTLYAFTREYTAPVPEGESRDDPRLLMFKSTDGAQSWQIIPFLKKEKNFGAPYAAVDRSNGNLYVVYPATVKETPEGEAPGGMARPGWQGIYFTASRDGGKTWSDPVQIDKTNEPSDSFAPNISVAPNGRIDVAWHDFRNDPFGAGQIQSFGRGERYWDVYHTYSTDGGQTWSSDTRVTKEPIDAGVAATYNNKAVRGPVGLASTNDAAYIAWPDSRATGKTGQAEDAYFARLRFVDADNPALGTASLATGSSSPSWLWLGIGAGSAFALGGVVLLIGVRRTRRVEGRG